MELLERESFLESLTSYADEALLGQGRVVLIAGEAGVGKTALAEAFQVRLPGATWAWGACDGLSTPRPLAPLHDIAQHIGGELRASLRAGASREDLFDGMLDRLRSDDLSVVVVEDLHWTDEATLDLLRFLARRVHELRALILVTYRDEALDGDPLLRGALSDLASYRGTRRMALPPLTESAVATLVRGTAHAPAELHRLTGGNPYFLLEVLDAHGVAVPPSVRDAVLARADRLSSGARRALEVASLLGSRPDPRVLAGVEAVETEALDECVQAGMLVAQPGGVVFRHDLARLAIAAAIPPGRRTELHRSILRRLRAHGARDDAQLAYHADEAHDGPAVLQHATAAARAAAAVASHREAAAQYARALRYGELLAPRERAELYEAKGRELGLLDRWDESATAYEAALAIWRADGDELRLATVLSRLVRPYWRLCRGQDCDRVAEEAVRLLEALPPGPELARAVEARCTMLWSSGRLDEARTEARRAQELAREYGLTDCLSDAMNTEACLRATLGEDGIPQLYESLATALEGGHAPQVGRAYANIHAIFVEEWRLAEAEQAYGEAVAWADANDAATFGSCLRGAHTLSLRQQGRIHEALDLAEAVIRAGLPSPVNSLNPLSSAGVLRARIGDTAVAWASLDEALGHALTLGEAPWVVRVRLARAEAYWLEGRLEEATDEVAKCVLVIAGPDPGPLGEVGAWARRFAVEHARLAELGEPSEAWARELAGEPRGSAEEWTRLGAHYYAAMALAFSDDVEDVREALERFRVMEAPAAEARMRQRLRELGADAVPAGPRASTRAHPAGLTRRESEVLGGLARGSSNAELAAELFLSERTVEHHVSNVLGKLGVATRADAAREAARRGLLDTVPG